MKQFKASNTLRRYKICLGVLLGCLLALTATAQESKAIDLVLQDAPLGVALKLVADQAGKKFEAHTSLDDMVNANFQGVSLETAINTLLDKKPYMWALDNDVLHIFKGWNTPTAPIGPLPPAPIVAPPPEKPVVTRIFALKKRKVEGVLDLVTRLGSREVSIAADAPTNSLVMIGQEKQIETVASLAREIDDTPVAFEVAPPDEIISESFILEYVTEFAELEKSLVKILYGEDMNANSSTGNEAQMAMQNQILGTLSQANRANAQGGKKEFYMFDRIRRVLMITAARSKMAMIRQYLQQINTPVPQVLIEAHIVALEEGTDRNLGINWNMQERWGGIYSAPDRRQGNTSTGGNTGTQIGGGFYFGRWDLSNVTSVLQAVQDQNRGQILSEPRLMTLSGRTATIDISTQYPYKSSVTLNQTGTTQNVQFVNVGIILNVLPQVNEHADTVVMQLDPNVSDLVSLSADGPITTQRRTSTNVEVKNGETVVIGGLLRDENARGNKTVPFLSQIPVIGDFFKFSQKRKKRTNLMILITPRIVSLHRTASARISWMDSGPASPASSLPQTVEEQTAPQAPVAIPIPRREETDRTHSERPAQTAPGKDQGQSDYQKRVEELRSKYLKND